MRVLSVYHLSDHEIIYKFGPISLSRLLHREAQSYFHLPDELEFSRRGASNGPDVYRCAASISFLYFHRSVRCFSLCACTAGDSASFARSLSKTKCVYLVVWRVICINIISLRASEMKRAAAAAAEAGETINKRAAALDEGADKISTSIWLSHSYTLP